MKVHIGVDSETGVVHSMSTTSANVHDVTEAHRLLHGREKRVWGDTGYQGVAKREERRKASIRAKVEHPFLWVKRRFGYAKVRYRGLAKNTQRPGVAVGAYQPDNGGASPGSFIGPTCAQLRGVVTTTPRRGDLGPLALPCVHRKNPM